MEHGEMKAQSTKVPKAQRGSVINVNGVWNLLKFIFMAPVLRIINLLIAPVFRPGI